MKVTDFTRNALRIRKDFLEMPRLGWEYLGEGGGKIWELERGWRYDQKIIDVRIAENGKGVWVKVEKS